MKLFRKYRDGGEELVDALVQAGIDTVYSIPGAQLLSVWDAIGRRNDIELIVPRSEWEGVELAIQYFQKHGKPAVVMNTVGPGVVNELPALFLAQLYKATVICISPAQPDYKRRRIDRVFQGLRDEEILGPWAQIERYRLIKRQRTWLQNRPQAARSFRLGIALEKLF